MTDAYSSQNLRHSVLSLVLKETEKEKEKRLISHVNDRHSSTQTTSRSGTPNTTQAKTFRVPNSSLKSRIPWLEGRPDSRHSGSSKSTKPEALTSISQTKLLPMTDTNQQLQKGPEVLPSPSEKRGSFVLTPVARPISPIIDYMFRSVDLSTSPSTPTDDSGRRPGSIVPTTTARPYSSTIDYMSISPSQPTDGSKRKSSILPNLAKKTILPRIEPISHTLMLSGDQSSPTDDCTRKGPIEILMQPPTTGNLKPTTEETPLVDSRPRKRSLLDSIYSSKGPPSPVFNHNPNDSLSELDTSPLTHAIRRLEDLMKEAGDLVNDAANIGYGSEAGQAAENSSLNARTLLAGETLTLAQSSLWTGADMAKDPSSLHATQPREFLVDANISELSLDSDESSTKTPVRFHISSWEKPIIRDFAYPETSNATSNLTSRKASEASEHWVGWRPTRDLAPQRSIQIKNVRDADFNRQAHTAYISDSPPSPGIQTLRQRKKSVHIIEEEPSKKQEWRPPRHNTYYDDSWQPDLNPPPLKSRKPSIVPVPWSEKTRKRRGHHKLSSGEHSERDIEKAGTGGGGGARPRRRWHLGHAKTEPIARNWSRLRKRISALVACFNTGIVGFIIGVYAGMVPRIQFQLADQKHDVLLGNVYMFIGLATSTFFCWPLPLLHGRKPYILASLGLAVPLQFPQAILVSQFRPPVIFGFEFGLLSCRFMTGILLGLTNINDFATLLDLFGASLQSDHPHQEVVQYDDVRREGGGIGVWLGVWAWCWVGSVSVGFLSGAGIIGVSNPAWGFYISVVLMIIILFLNVVAPETRHSSLRRTLRELKVSQTHEERVARKVARGEIKLHISDEGPRYWFQELWAGVVLSKRMFFQRGFSVLSLYLGWIYGQNILVIVLLGALLSREYKLPSKYVGLGVLSISIGALLAVPLTHAGLFSRARKSGPRTDSMTFEHQVTWSSHMIRRIIFMLMLPIAGVVYTFVSPGIGVHWMVPVAFAGAIGFFDSLAVAECYGLVMETYDLSDLQPGVNSRHRLSSLADNVRRRRTNYSSFPRVSAGIFVSQSMGFLFAAAATGVGGVMTRDLGAQYSTGITAGVLFFLTILLTLALIRYKSIQVVPNHTFGTVMAVGEVEPDDKDEFWTPVILGNPSGKVRRINLLEMGKLSRWMEIRRLNKLA